MKPPRPSAILPAIRLRHESAFGHLHISIVVDAKRERELELFAWLGKCGDMVAADLEGICRLASLYMRAGGELKDVAKQLRGIGASVMASEKHSSVPDALGEALEVYLAERGRVGIHGLIFGAEEPQSAPINNEPPASSTSSAPVKIGDAIIKVQPTDRITGGWLIQRTERGAVSYWRECDRGWTLREETADIICQKSEAEATLQRLIGRGWAEKGPVTEDPPRSPVKLSLNGGFAAQEGTFRPLTDIELVKAWFRDGCPALPRPLTYLLADPSWHSFSPHVAQYTGDAYYYISRVASHSVTGASSLRFWGEHSSWVEFRDIGARRFKSYEEAIERLKTLTVEELRAL